MKELSLPRKFKMSVSGWALSNANSSMMNINTLLISFFVLLLSRLAIARVCLDVHVVFVEAFLTLVRKNEIDELDGVSPSAFY